MTEYKYSLDSLERMYPWERDVYISIFNKYMKKKNEMNNDG